MIMLVWSLRTGKNLKILLILNRGKIPVLLVHERLDNISWMTGVASTAHELVEKCCQTNYGDDHRTLAFMVIFNTLRINNTGLISFPVRREFKQLRGWFLVPYLFLPYSEECLGEFSALQFSLTLKNSLDLSFILIHTSRVPFLLSFLAVNIVARLDSLWTRIHPRIGSQRCIKQLVNIWLEVVIWPVYFLSRALPFPWRNRRRWKCWILDQ